MPNIAQSNNWKETIETKQFLIKISCICINIDRNEFLLWSQSMLWWKPILKIRKENSLKKWQTFFFSFSYGLQIAALILLWIKLSEPNFSTKLILWFGIFDIEWCTMRRVCVKVKSFFLWGEVDSSSDDLNSLQHQQQQQKQQPQQQQRS